ncbi:unnamed protein product [Diamesa hyperborea]
MFMAILNPKPVMKDEERIDMVYTDCGKKHKKPEFNQTSSKVIKLMGLGSELNITQVKYRQCRGFFCISTQEGDQDITIKFQTNTYPFHNRTLYYTLVWHHNNATNLLTIHRVLCDGSIDCSIMPQDGTHALSDPLMIHREVTHYGFFKWESWTEETNRLLCIESIYFDKDGIEPHAVVSLNDRWH